MKKLSLDIATALSIHQNPDEWGRFEPHIGAMAKLIWRYLRHTDGEEVPEEITKSEFPALDWHTALSVLSNLHDWWAYSEEEAEKVGGDIQCVFERFVANAPPIDLMTIVSKRMIRNAREANMVIQRLLEANRAQAPQTVFDLALMEALANWSSYKAHGLLDPGELKEIRKSPPLKWSQEKMARALDMTLRQYVKYEAGTTPIPDDKVERIKALVEEVNRENQKSSIPEPSPKRFHNPVIDHHNLDLWTK